MHLTREEINFKLVKEKLNSISMERNFHALKMAQMKLEGVQVIYLILLVYLGRASSPTFCPNRPPKRHDITILCLGQKHGCR